MSDSAAPSIDAMNDTPDVTSTLAELERKLRELERELTSIGRRGAGLAAGPEVYPEPSGRLIDEGEQPLPPAAAIEQPSYATPIEQPSYTAPIQQPAQAERASAPSDAQLASLADLRRFRDRLDRFAKELIEDYDDLLGRVMSSLSGSAPSEHATPAATLAPSPPPAPASPHEEILFDGRVELGVGPFYDIASLSAFERRLAELPYVTEASVRRFEASHAVIDLQVTGPVALIRALRHSLDSDFGVRQIASGRVLLTFDEA